MSEIGGQKQKKGNPADSGGWEPKIAAFLCNWCSYAGADLAGVSRMQYEPSVRIIRVPCSSRTNPLYILKALQNGVDGVLVAGCHPGSCHYISGNMIARRKFALMKRLLVYIGIEPERVQFSWVSASEGNRFAALIHRVTEDLRRVGPARKMVRDIAGEVRWIESALHNADAGSSDGKTGPTETARSSGEISP